MFPSTSPAARRRGSRPSAPWRSLAVAVGVGLTATAAPLPGTAEWTDPADPAAAMVAGLDRYLDREAERLAGQRLESARRDYVDPDRTAASRRELADALGVVDPREPGRLTVTAPVDGSGEVARAGEIRILAVHWPVFRQVRGEGLLLLPEGTPRGDVIVVPDCDVTPEQAVLLDRAPDATDPGFPLQMARAGFRVLVPGLVDRGSRWAGNPPYRPVRHSQRETLWRAGYQVGRHLLGYEVQRILAGADALAADAPPDRPLALAGHGEGGTLALLAGAIDPRFEAVLAAGSFGTSTDFARLPVYRNIWRGMTRWGDAELAALIAPRPVVVERGEYPQVIHTDAHGGAPGRLGTPGPEVFAGETARWRAIAPDAPREILTSEPGARLGETARRALIRWLGLQAGPPPGVAELPVPAVGTDPVAAGAARGERLYRGLLEDTQDLMRDAGHARAAFWKDADRGSVEGFVRSTTPLREHFRDRVVGMIPPASLAPAPKSRLLWHTNGIRGFEVRLEVHPDVFATGILAIPDGIPPGERRPVVVCQHGLEGRPRDVADPFTDHPAYHRYAFRLAEKGFITFSPQNPYIGGTTFRQVLRKAQPLGLTLWSFVVRQHEVILDWLGGLESVDPARIAFYGLSYGGKTAMRVPVLVDRYCLSICSADFNEWIWKNTSARSPYSYLWTSEYDMPEWNLASTFNYAELSWLIFPRPFMVERGHDDGVAPDEWVAYEYARTRRHYVKMGLGDRTRIEFFDGPHTIHGEGTFHFLWQHLNWPPPPPPR